MKKFLLTLVIAVLGVASASAQKAEISVGYGAYTQMDAMNMHDDWHGVNTAWGALTAAVNFRVAPKFWIGPSYTFSSCSTTGGSNASHIAYHAVMFNGRYHYFQNRGLKLYGKLGVGVEISHFMPKFDDSYDKVYCAFQITPIGLQYDFNRTVGIYSELGFGAQGVVQVGLKFNL